MSASAAASGWMAVEERHASRLEGVVLLTFAGLLALFLLLWGQYPYVGSHYLRYLPIGLTVGATVVVFRAVRDLPWFQRKGWGRGVLMALCSVGATCQAQNVTPRPHGVSGCAASPPVS